MKTVEVQILDPRAKRLLYALQELGLLLIHESTASKESSSFEDTLESNAGGSLMSDEEFERSSERLLASAR